MGLTTTKPNKFNEIFESANRLRTVRNAPNPFLVVRKEEDEAVTSDREAEQEEPARKEAAGQ